MQYVKLGNTGLDVSKLCLGCMSFGDASRWTHPWVLDEERSRPIIKKAIDLGINFFDTANVYSTGASEEIVGRALKEFANRDEIVIATKVHFRMRQGPNGAGLSRKAIMSEIDKSLKRLGTDYVDLYQIHRWDYGTPIEETMEALHDVVKAGKARYIGGFGDVRLAVPQSAACRGKEWLDPIRVDAEPLQLAVPRRGTGNAPALQGEKIGVIPYSPLAAGRLLRDPGETTPRTETDQAQKSKYDAMATADRPIAERVAAIAAARGVPRVQIALAWMLQKETVTSPIIGVTSISQLEEAVPALSVLLTAEEIASLEEPYVPHRVVGAL